jgi:hypothetical protein
VCFRAQGCRLAGRGSVSSGRECVAVRLGGVLRVDLVAQHFVVLVDFEDAVSLFRAPVSAGVAVEEVAPFTGNIDAGLAVVVPVENGADVRGGFQQIHDRLRLRGFRGGMHAPLGPVLDAFLALRDMDHHEDGRGVLVGLQFLPQPSDIGRQVGIGLAGGGGIGHDENEVAVNDGVVGRIAPDPLP